MFPFMILLAGALPSTRTIAVAIFTYNETGQEAAATAMVAVSAVRKCRRPRPCEPNFISCRKSLNSCSRMSCRASQT